MFLMVGNASASLVGTDLLTSGDGLITIDDETGLEWLDMPLTNGMSYQAVSDSTYVNTHGFHFATEAELHELYNNMGMDIPTGVPSGGAPVHARSDLYVPIHTLHDYLGMTYVASGQNAILGVIGIVSGEMPLYRSIYYD